MQKQNIEPINLQHKCSVIIKKPKYLLNDGFSWVLAAIENGKLNEKSTEEDVFKLKLELVADTEKRLGQFLRSNNNKKGILFDPCPYCIDIPYFIVGDNLNRINWQSGNYITDNLSSSNDRVLNCTVTQEINNGWTCNFTLDNTDDIYTLNNYYQGTNQDISYGNYILNQNDTCVIEPNDEVEVYMSDWKGEMHCVFTGLVSNVNKTDDGLRKAINVSCNDILKKLSWNYFNVQASFDIRESRGIIPSVYGENYQSLTLNQVVSMLLGGAYCDIYKRDSFLLELIKIYADGFKKTTSKKYRQVIINNEEQMVEVKKTQEEIQSQSVAIQKINDAISKEIKKYLKPEMLSIVKVEMDGQEHYVTAKAEETSYARRCTIDYEKIVTAKTNDGNKIQTPFLDYDEGEIIFKIEGISQPAWSWTVRNGGYDYLFSNLKRTDEFIRSIANIVQYEFFADGNGIIYFRPPNFVLPRATILDIDMDKYDGFIKDNYWITEDKEQYFTQINTSVNDNNIYTRVNIIGKFVELAWTNEFLKTVGYAPQWWLNKYGLRVMPTVTRSGLNNVDACKTYAEMLLWKNNINYELCETVCLLNSNFRIGVPIYIERQLAVWYIGRVIHSFNSGSGCSTSLTLTYKRTPLCLRKDLQKYLNENLSWGKLSQTEFDYIKNNEELLCWGRMKTNIKTQKDLIDYMFVWSPIPSDLYLLTLELQNQLDITNYIKRNDRKTLLNNMIKSRKSTKIIAPQADVAESTNVAVEQSLLWSGLKFSDILASYTSKITQNMMENEPIYDKK